MDLSLNTLLLMARHTVQNPREGARIVMRANLPMTARWIALALSAVISSLLAHTSFSLMPVNEQAQLSGALTSPISTAVMQAVLMLVSVHLVHWVGRWMGGKGNFADALILLVWLQFILLILQVMQIVVQVLVPPLADLLGLASVAIFLWLLSNFIAELHKFNSVVKVFFGVILCLMGVAIILAFLMLPLIGAGM